MADKLKQLTGKNPADFEPVAYSLINNPDTDLFRQLVEKDDFLYDFIKDNVIKRLAKVNKITYADIDAPTPPKSATAVVSTSKLIVPLADLIDLDSEIKRQEKKLEKLTNEKNSLLGRMKNEKFVANAPKELVEQTNARIEELSAQEDVIKDLIQSLK